VTFKRNRKINRFITQLYGFTALIAGSVGGLTGISYWLYRVWLGESEFSWIKFLGITFFSLLIATIGFILLRAGIKEEVKEDDESS
jgi:hypothetical protein